MVASFFRGEKHLFEGTSIYERGNTDAKNGTWIAWPVIHMNFGKILDEYIAYPKEEYFRAFWRQHIEAHRAKYNCYAEYTFFLLIRSMRQKYNLPVVVLGDEYDRPMDYALNVLKNIDVAEHMQSVAKSFMYNLVEEEDKIKLALVVGVTKIDVDQESIPEYRDLTHHTEFASIMGFSRQEIDTYFQPFVRKFAENRSRTPEDIMKELIQRYDGYRFARDDNGTRVFNPVSVIESIRKEDLAGNHPYSNHSLERITRALIKQNLTAENLESFNVSREILLKIDRRSYPLKAGAVPLSVDMLLQGYLTITGYDEKKDTATLGYANDEVRRIIASRLNAEKDQEIHSNG